MSASGKRCKECAPTGKRKAPYPGPRCATHHRVILAQRRSRERARRMLERYGITPAEYDALYQLQGGCCFICERAKGARKRLVVDHDHVSGDVRGLLCNKCNRDVLGHLRDDRVAILRAVEYLDNPPATRLLTRPVAPVAATRCSFSGNGRVSDAGLEECASPHEMRGPTVRDPQLDCAPHERLAVVVAG